MKYYLFFLSAILSTLCMVSCIEQKKPIVESADYEKYLNQKSIQSMLRCNAEIGFWKEKLKESPQSETFRLKLAGLYSGRFRLNGAIADIYTSDSLYNAVLNVTAFSQEKIYQSLATNCITKHEFRQAKRYVEKALSYGDMKAISYLILVDVDLELGDYAGAKKILNDFTNKNSFAYLIREAKLKDHEGNIDTAILLMERAFERMKDNKTLYVWTKSNLADMLGHAGRVHEAYETYLEVLKLDPDYEYALKGIAWIALSNDHNSVEAKRIINFINSRKSTPDMHLLLAKIAGFEKDDGEKTKQLALFRNEVSNPKYLGMYNKYMATLEAEEFSNPAKAIEIGELEVRNRPTPQSFDLLAWGYYKDGNVSKALEVVKQHVEGKTFEPEALYHLGMIYQNYDHGKSKEFLTKAARSAFELGPEITSKIEAQLN